MPRAAPVLIRLVARGSPLSRVQAEEVSATLRTVFPGSTVQSQWVSTRGDQSESPDFRGQLSVGVFEKEVDEEVLADHADLAVHSLKDLPPDLPNRLEILAVLPRGPSGDLLVGKSEVPRLDRLPPGTRVGTSSPRRRAMVRYHNAAVEVVPLRGNVGTRVERMNRGDCEALVMAEAGIRRLGLHVDAASLPPQEFPPAPGQGIVALVGRSDRLEEFEALRASGGSSWSSMRAERAFLEAVGGGCSKALGGQLLPEAGTFVAAMWKEDGSARKLVHLRIAGSGADELGREAAMALKREAWIPRP